MPPSRNSRLEQYRRLRRKFSFKVYAITSIFVLITVVQWIAITEFLPDVSDIIEENVFITLLALFAAMLIVSMFVFFENIRFIVPVNWLLSLFIVECVAIGLLRAVSHSSLSVFLYSLIFDILLMIILILLAIFIKHDFTLDVVILFVIAIIFFISAVFFAMVHILTTTKYSMYFYVIFVGATVMLFTIYHAQTIHGSRYAEMRLKDYLLAALIIYHDLIILLMLTLYLMQAIGDTLPELASWSNSFNGTTTTLAPVNGEEGAAPQTTLPPPGS